jgi:hypothetical protein
LGGRSLILNVVSLWPCRVIVIPPTAPEDIPHCETGGQRNRHGGCFARAMLDGVDDETVTV